MIDLARSSLVLLLCTPAVGQQLTEQAILTELEIAHASLEAKTEAIAALGAEAGPLCVRLLARVGESTGEVSLSSEQQKALLLAIQLVPARPLVDLVDDYNPSKLSLEQRTALLKVMRYIGMRDSMDDSLALADPAGLAPFECFTLGEELRMTLRSIFHRDPPPLRELRSVLSRVHPILLPPVIQAADGLPAASRVELLTEVLGERPEMAELLLSKLVTAVPTGLLAPRPEWAAPVRPYLTSPDEQLASSAAYVLGRLADVDSLPALIECLDDTRPMLRGSAHQALKTISGLGFAATRARWERWFEQEDRWFRERSDAACDGLTSPRAADVSKALQEIACHRMQRHSLSSRVCAALDHPQRSLRIQACRVLAQLDSLTSLAPLVRSLDDEAEVAAAAHDSLRTITGMQLPLDSQAWQAHLTRAGLDG